MANGTVKIQATINGQTVTIAELVGVDPAVTTGGGGVQAIALSFDRPIKVDAGTAINLVSVQAAMSITAASVQTLSQAY